MFRRKGKVKEGKGGRKGEEETRTRKKKRGETKRKREKKTRKKEEVMIFTCKIVTVRNRVSAIHVDMCACTVLSFQIRVYQFKAVNYFHMIMILNQKKTAVCNNVLFLTANECRSHEFS